ncbi:MAG: multiheme c-type cytochrome [Pirellula sp.]
MKIQLKFIGKLSSDHTCSYSCASLVPGLSLGAWAIAGSACRGVWVFLLIWVTALGCTSSKKSVAVIVGGDTAGWITPCGCAANQSGGLARRATVLQNLASFYDLVFLDAGGSATGINEYHRLKLASILRGLKQMGLAAHNIGGTESEFSPDELRELARETEITWLSSNLSDATGEPIGSSSVVLKRAGLRVAIVGVIEPSRVRNARWKVVDPVQSILSEMASLDADVRIVLAYCDESGLRKLAESLPEVDYIIGGPTGQSFGPTKVGPVTLLSATNKGKFLAQVSFAGKGKSVRHEIPKIVEVKSDHAEDTVQKDNLVQYYQSLRQRDFTVKQAGLADHLSVERRGYEIAGSNSCQACHKLDDAVWHSSKHAKAWEPLLARQAEFDPHCQQCHSTGYGYSGGFINVAQSKHRTGVGCENCHGPSSSHVADPRIKTPVIAKEQCIRCHDHENSPEFKYDPYWAKIAHPKE